MSLSILPPQFLLDENVREELFKFLKTKKIKVQRCPKGISNGVVISLSKKNKWILVTNDSDFALYSPKKLFSVVLLRIAQGDVEGLLSSFELLLTKFKEKFEGKLIVLKRNSWEVSPLSRQEE